MLGISKDKLKGVRMLLMGEGTLPPPRMLSEKPKVKYNQAKACWCQLFKLCQRPNATTRLFPVNISYPVVWEDYFVPWFKQTLPHLVDEMPCFGWFMAARHNTDFKDVKNRPMHHHCRCLDCANV